jgi:hypothetical protein
VNIKIKVQVEIEGLDTLPLDTPQRKYIEAEKNIYRKELEDFIGILSDYPAYYDTIKLAEAVSIFHRVSYICKSRQALAALLEENVKC